ncbi:hypothetical protein AVEN_26408-1, partial [Araneus ventricosus]
MERPFLQKFQEVDSCSCAISCQQRKKASDCHCGLSFKR